MPVGGNHPFDDPALLRVVERYAPGYVEGLKTCVRPAMSRNPDELERWEAKHVLLRKERLDHESDYMYLIRVLYEESFSVQQIKDVVFHGSGGFTPGGLISHGYIDRFEELPRGTGSLKVFGSTLREALEQEPDRRMREKIIGLAFESTYPFRFDDHGLSGGPSDWTELMRRIRTDPTQPYPEEVDARGFRLLRLLTQVPWLTSSIENWRSKKRCGYDHLQRLPLMRTVYLYWAAASRAVLPRGYFVSEDVSGADERLKLLLEMRTQPELAAIYRHLSASGCLNELALG